jgi:hypothetical protein
MNYAEIAKQYLDRSDVVYITSDGLAFFELHFATSHAQSKGLEVHKIEKPKEIEVIPTVEKPIKTKKNANK